MFERRVGGANSSVARAEHHVASRILVEPVVRAHLREQLFAHESLEAVIRWQFHVAIGRFHEDAQHRRNDARRDHVVQDHGRWNPHGVLVAIEREQQRRGLRSASVPGRNIDAHGSAIAENLAVDVQRFN